MPLCRTDGKRRPREGQGLARGHTSQRHTRIGHSSLFPVWCSSLVSLSELLEGFGVCRWMELGEEADPQYPPTSVCPGPLSQVCEYRSISLFVTRSRKPMHSQTRHMLGLLSVQCSLWQTESSGSQTFCVPRKTSAGLAWGRSVGCGTARRHSVPGSGWLQPGMGGGRRKHSVIWS